MNKTFIELFSREPDEIINGDYFYKTWYKNIELSEKPCEIREIRDKEFRYEGFRQEWKRKSYQRGIELPYWNFKNAEINKIAFANKPFIDIASSEYMGLAPYIIKLNPKIPCLITDLTANSMKLLHLCVNENIPDYNVSIASFDNYDIPIKNNSFDYVTSRLGISSSTSNILPKNIYQFSTGREKAIDEVYRILKPDGCFVTFEMNRECKFSLQKVYNEYNERGKLFGLYTYDEIQAVLELLIEEPWRDKFVSAGFKVEVEKKHYYKYSLDSTMNFLYLFTKYHNIHHWEKFSWEEQKQTESFIWDPNIDVENIGINFYGVNIFY